MKKIKSKEIKLALAFHIVVLFFVVYVSKINPEFMDKIGEGIRFVVDKFKTRGVV